MIRAGTISWLIHQLTDRKCFGWNVVNQWQFVFIQSIFQATIEKDCQTLCASSFSNEKIYRLFRCKLNIYIYFIRAAAISHFIYYLSARKLIGTYFHNYLIFKSFLILFFVISDCKRNIFLFWTCWLKQEIWIHHLRLCEIIAGTFGCWLKFYRHNDYLGK